MQEQVRLQSGMLERSFWLVSPQGRVSPWTARATASSKSGWTVSLPELSEEDVRALRWADMGAQLECNADF